MGDFWNENDDVDDEQQGQGDGPADLRKAHRAATRKIKELESKITELTETNGKLSKRVRHLDIADLLPKGVSPKVAKLIPEDVEPTADAVKAWLDEFGDVFNIKVDDKDATVATTTSDDTDDTDDGDGTPTLDANTLAALAAFQNVSAGGTAIPTGAAGDLAAKAANAKSFDDVIQILNASGIETVSGY
jgi:hypothetical protein